MNLKLMFAAVVMIVASVVSTAGSYDWPFTRWVTTWTAPAMPPTSAFPPRPTALENQTIRHVVHLSVGGRRVRVQLSNAFGAAPLRIGAAHVALHETEASIVPGTDRVLTFSGQSSIAIPKGAVALSDPVTLDVPARGDLAVSIYVPENTGLPTFHSASARTTYVSGAGDFTDATTMPFERTTTSRFWLSAVEVSAIDHVGTIVALGDSITLGARSTLDANRTWPDLLSARLNPRFGLPRFSVVNQGIGCNRLLWDICGQSGAARFERDVLAITGVSHVVVALGLNDIGIPSVVPGWPQTEVVSAQQIIVGLEQLIARARTKRIAIYGATITPVGSSVVPGFFTPETEAKRQEVNQWIRTSHAFDGVIDFDRAVRDPGEPTRLLLDYNSGDGIHPSDAGYQAMANAIELSMFFR